MNVIFYICNVLCSSGQSALGKQYSRKGGASLPFNINKAAIGMVLFLVWGITSGFSLHIPTMMFGLIYGVSLCISMHAGFKALSMGPMALTSMLASFSLIIPFLFGVLFWNETLTLFKLMGIILLLCSILCINMKREKGFSAKWFFYAMATLISNGVCSILQKTHQMKFPSLYRIEFMFWAMLSVLVILVATYKVKEGTQTPLKISLLGLSSGVANCLANYIVLYLSATEQASVLFPIISICNIIVVWMIGIVCFKERLRLLQVMGLITGIVSVGLLNR